MLRHLSGGSQATAATLTIGPGVTVHGTQGGTIQGYYAGDTLVNQGTIDADAAGRTISIYAPGWSNAGLLRASNGGMLNLGGTSANIGTFDAIGGVVALTGTLDNTGKTVAMTAATGSLMLAGGTVQGGAVSATGGARLIAQSGTLDGVTLACDVLIGDGRRLDVRNGLTLAASGSVTLSNAGAFGTSLYFLGAGAQTLGGSGQVVFAGTSALNFVYIQGGGAQASAATLTIGPGVTVHGIQGGTIQGYYPGDTLVNRGTIDADAAGKTIRVSGDNWTNEGLLKASNGGTLELSGVTNSGLITPGGDGEVGGTIAITGNLVQTAAGTLRIDIGGLTAVTQFDRLAVSGSATLDGTVALKLINSYAPPIGTTFQFLTFASCTGTFAQILDLDPGDGIGFGPTYIAGNVTLTTAAGGAMPESLAPAAAAVPVATSPMPRTTPKPEVSKPAMTFSTQPIAQRRPKRRVAGWY